MAKIHTFPTVGVICEFNPFHNGHAYLLKKARELATSDGCVVCVMSGRSTQRGECVIADPYLRARIALLGGADLVVELPFPWSSASAEGFADAGVRILTALGVEHLIFGSECGDIELLSRAAACVSSEAFVETYASLCRDGKGTASAYTDALTAVSDTQGLSLPEGFPSSNDLLGISYLAAIARTANAMTPHTICRLGQGYRDCSLTDSNYPSATALRRLIREAACDPYALSQILADTMPEGGLELLLDDIQKSLSPTEDAPLHALYHAHFRLADSENRTNIAELGGGLYKHLCRTALSSVTPEAFMRNVETKQYTRARLRRGMLFAVCGVTEEDLKASPQYTTVLAVGRNGRKLLSSIRKMQRPLPIITVTKPADAPEGRQKQLSGKIDALYTLCLPSPQEAGWLIRRSAYIED